MTISRDELTPGKRVIVRNAGHLSGQTGTVIEMAAGLLNGHDCCVEMDLATGIHDERWPLCFYAHELSLAPYGAS